MIRATLAAALVAATLAAPDASAALVRKPRMPFCYGVQGQPILDHAPGVHCYTLPVRTRFVAV